MKEINQMIDFLNHSVTSYQAIEKIEKQLQEKGFQQVYEIEKWNLEKGKSYYVKRNQSSLIAFRVGKRLEDMNFNIVASHSDAPAFKLKPNYKMTKENFVQLNTEVYGGPIYSTWMDRLLSVAGRLLVKEGKEVVSKLVCLDKPCGIIPNVAIHLNREANKGMKYNEQVDLLPFVSIDKDFDFMDYLAKEVNVKKSDIVDSDLYLYPTQKAEVWGSQNEFISSYHLDDLQCAYATLQGFLKGTHKDTVNMYCCFDNEEVGSGTRQGAASTFLQDTLGRIQSGLDIENEKFKQVLASSFLVSADNAHAYHPNHSELTDPTNTPQINKGVVIKYSANKKYATDGLSAAIFKEICHAKKVSVQAQTNRSDVAGGSTLGPIVVRSMGILSVDIGLPQLAMHSSYETAGIKDTEMLISAMEEFFSTHRIVKEDNRYEMRKES